MQRPHNPNKDKETFTQVDYLTNKQVSSAHDVSKLTKNKKTPQTSTSEQTPQDIWYCKKHSSLRGAVLEVVAQEFFRFISPQQPKTRVAEKIVNGKLEYYVISKEIKNSHPLTRWPREYLKKKFEDGKIKGFGTIDVLSLFVNETDLRLHNIHLPFPSWQTLKIDGDACFKRLQKKDTREGHKISPDAISILPFIDENYLPRNFFDIVINGKWHESVLFDPNIDLPSYRKEINETLLKILLLPKTFFTRFVGCYTNDVDLITEIAREFEQRQDDLKAAAFSSLSFNEYMRTSEAAANYQSFLATSKAFRSTRKNSFSNIVADFEQDAQTEFAFMHNLSEFYVSAAQTQSQESKATSSSETAPAVPDFHSFNLTAEDLFFLFDRSLSPDSETARQNPNNRNCFFAPQENNKPSEEERPLPRKRKGFESHS